MPEPTRSPAQQLLIGLVQAYRLLFKAWIGPVCRFEPSCSAYALEALQRHGALRGGGLAGRRLLRCHPWCDGGFDPVPDESGPARRGPFTSLLSRESGGPVPPHPPTA
jgi:putative membrane protein insertion efficiency factor